MAGSIDQISFQLKKAARRVGSWFGSPHRSNAVSVTKQQVLQQVAKVMSPRKVSLEEAGVLSDVLVDHGKVMLSINVDASEAKDWEAVRSEVEQLIRALPGVSSALVALTAERRGGPPPTARPSPRSGGIADVGGHRPAPPPHGSPMARQAAIPGVRAIIAVASGKGGVGKSTTAINLALGLRDLGLRVGVLDADIYGPSMPKLTGIREKPQLNDAKKMIPVVRFGLKVMSIGFLVEENTPMIWRGPMVMSAITQMLREVEWGELDVMVVDMPPGTGDAQLTLAQQVPLQGAVIVSTPQDLALIDARRGLAMFTRVNVPVLGIIENMSYFSCPHCGTRSDIFGHGGASHEARELKLPFLGEVPLHMDIRATSDAGTPLVHSQPDGEHAAIYRTIAGTIAQRLGMTVTQR